MSTYIKLSSKTQISKIIQSGVFLGPLLSKIGNSYTWKIHGSGITTLIISNEKMNDIMEIVQSLKDSNVLLKGITKGIENETKEQKGGSLKMLPGTLRAAITFIMFWDFLMFYQILLSSQVKRSAVISNKHGIWELPYELPNNLKRRILGN